MIQSVYKGWIVEKNNGFLLDQHMYTKGKFYCALDYDDDESAKKMWMLHHEDGGFIRAFDTLGEAIDYVGDDAG